MIVCTKCGFENEDADTFCGSCAGFLEWSGQKVHEAAPEPEPEPEPEVEAEEGHPGFIERVKDRIGIGDKDEDAPGSDEVPAAASNGAETAEAPEAAPVSTPAAPAAVAAASTAAPPAPSGPSVSAPSSTPAPAAAAAGPAPAAATSSPSAPTAPPPVAATATAAPPEAKSGAPAAAVTAAAAATAPVAPAATTKTEPVQPAAVQPQAVKPQAVKTRPTPKQKQASTRVINPGDLVCGQCGEGNDPKRKFCRRCGASLQEAAVFALPWYQRWWRSLTRKKVRTAGERPKNRRRLIGGSGPGLVWSVVRIVLIAAVVVVGILALTSHSFRHRISGWYHDVNVKYTAVHPPQPGATANSQQIKFPPSLAIDEATNTHWATAATNNGVGATLTIRMSSPTNIDKIGFLNGNQDGAPSNTISTFSSEPALKDIRVVVSEILPEKNAQGQTVNTAVTKFNQFTLNDEPNFKSFTVSYKNVRFMEITILSVYPATSNPPGHNASLAEVELFKKK
jgi:hypothetical protein